MAGRGPAPDPDALRRERDQGEWTLLPAGSRSREVMPPAFPLPRPVAREMELWLLMWAKPQSLMWERNGLDFEVAVFVRRFAEAEVAESSVALGTLVRQMSDSLGLTTPGMRNNRWKIVVDEVAPRRAASAQPSSRDRLRVDVVSA